MENQIPSVAYESIAGRRGALVHAGRSVAQADLYELQWEGRPALVKDFSARPWWVRRFWAPFVVRREVAALQCLQALPGVPRLYGRAGPLAFVMERVDGQRLPHRREPPPPPGFWANSRRLIDGLHRLGVAHGDLRRKNLLMDPEGRAYLIDFATAIRRRDRGLHAPLVNLLCRRLQKVDRVTYARIKASYQPEQLDGTERQWLQRTPWYLKAGRFMKKRLYRWIQPKFRRKQKRKRERRRRFNP